MIRWVRSRTSTAADVDGPGTLAVIHARVAAENLKMIRHETIKSFASSDAEPLMVPKSIRPRGRSKFRSTIQGVASCR